MVLLSPALGLRLADRRQRVHVKVHRTQGRGEGGGVRSESAPCRHDAVGADRMSEAVLDQTSYLTVSQRSSVTPKGPDVLPLTFRPPGQVCGRAAPRSQIS